MLFETLKKNNTLMTIPFYENKICDAWSNIYLNYIYKLKKLDAESINLEIAHINDALILKWRSDLLFSLMCVFFS